MLAVLLSGCAEDGGASGTADCATQIKFNGDVFTEIGIAEKHGPALGPAQLATCNDTGVEPDTEFEGGSMAMDVYELPGFDPAEILVGTRMAANSYVVLAARDLTSSDRERLRKARVDLY